ncbi:MAG TPA: DedA family protein [Anaerolineales bacterium]|nr:DedA family protein [Anaerolineales bacterium]
MDIISYFINFILHLDQYLNGIIQNYGVWTYAILFLIIFIETGLVIMPFLPGDSLLFAAGAFAALGSLNIWILWVIVFIAAALGDSVNYWIGNKMGPRAFEQDNRFLKREYLEKTQLFYEKHGGKTIILARFVPIVRTFAPFVAGVGSMNYGRFFAFNVTGALLWTTLFIFLGYFFGNIPFVKENFELAIFGIILISVVPMVIEFIRNRARKQTSPHTAV